MNGTQFNISPQKKKKLLMFLLVCRNLLKKVLKTKKA